MDQSQLYSLYDSDPAPIAAFLGYLRESYGLPTPTKVLDMGCGPGRMLRPLAESGWIVSGYEPDPEYAAAAEEAAQGLPGVRIRRAGLLDLDEVAAFDMVALINGPLSYVLDPRDRRAALERCRRALRPDGVLLVEVGNFPWILKNYRPPPDLQLEVDGVTVLRTARHEIDFHRGHFTHQDHFEWTDPDGEARRIDKTHRMAMIAFPEIAYFLADVGFTEVATFNEYDDREPAVLTGKRILVAARRGVE